jgi:phage terminase large subunit-like protein
MATRRRSTAVTRTEKVEPKEDKKTEPAPVPEVKKEENIVIPVVQAPVIQEPVKQQESRKV